MRWILVVMIGLCWHEADAKKSLTSKQCHKKIMDDWHDVKKHKVYKLREDEKSYFNSFDFEPRAGERPGKRKECRKLTEKELDLLFRAFKFLFTSRISDGRTRYEIFMAQHRIMVSPEAHGGPCFCGFHHYFLRRLEMALQEFDKRVFLCYWDSSLDYPLPNACESFVWTKYMFGNNDGFVTTGFAANLQAHPSDCADMGSSLRRQCGDNELVFTPEKLNELLGMSSSYEELVAPYSSSKFEELHGGPHMFCGGHMSQISCAVVDPVFFLHHCYVDYVWELCRKRYRNKDQPYPSDDGVPRGHGSSSTLFPFESMTCGRAMKNLYIPGSFTYEPSPSTIDCSDHDDCGSKALWCNDGKCTGCVREGGQMFRGWPARACHIPGCTQTENAGGTCGCRNRRRNG